MFFTKVKDIHKEDSGKPKIQAIIKVRVQYCVINLILCDRKDIANNAVGRELW